MCVCVVVWVGVFVTRDLLAKFMKIIHAIFEFLRSKTRFTGFGWNLNFLSVDET